MDRILLSIDEILEKDDTEDNVQGSREEWMILADLNNLDQIQLSPELDENDIYRTVSCYTVAQIGNMPV